MESVAQTLDELINYNRLEGDITGKEGNYWFILIKEDGLAVNPKMPDTPVYPCIAFELSDELHAWGLVIDKKFMDVIWIDENENPLSLLRYPLILKNNEVIGERLIYEGKVYSLPENTFKEVHKGNLARIDQLLNAYNNFKKLKMIHPIPEEEEVEE